jgi:hypothetical protein
MGSRARDDRAFWRQREAEDLPAASVRLQGDDALAAYRTCDGHGTDLGEATVAAYLELVDDPCGTGLHVEVPPIG